MWESWGISVVHFECLRLTFSTLDWERQGGEEKLRARERETDSQRSTKEAKTSTGRKREGGTKGGRRRGRYEREKKKRMNEKKRIKEQRDKVFVFLCFSLQEFSQWSVLCSSISV